MEIKDIIRQRREELNLTYEQLGNMIGVGKSTVRKWETGMIENMRRDNIVALAKALNISPSIIMGWNNEVDENKNDTKNLKIENDLKDIIISKYTDIKDFCLKNDIPYSKVDKIFKRGIGGADIQLVFKMCSVLDIDVNSIIEGELCFNDEYLKYTKFSSVLSREESTLLVNYNKLNTLGKEEANKRVSELTMIPTYVESKNNVTELITATKTEFDEEPHLMPKASHDKNGIFTDEEYKHDDDIMNNDDFWNK